MNGFVSGNKKFEDVIDDYAKLYAEKIGSNAVWSWADDVIGGNGLNYRQRKEIRLQAIEKGLIPDVPFKDGTKYPDFSKVEGLIEKIDYLPEEFWRGTDREQFNWLDSRIEGGRPKGMTWHHSEIDGKMELVPFGIHNIINHKGGRSPGHWAHIGKR
ncbi:HNH endonuclease [Priestia koreensis]|nr:HNH endonuclease [Priestia koreensis]